ncbi:MAG: Calx-beta domain-containing protein, partial [Planctomycetota bacterium]
SSGTLTFDPDVLSQTITVEIVGDTADESDETFVVNLTNLSANANLVDGQGVGTILDNDEPAPVFPTITIADASRNEPDPGKGKNAYKTVGLTFTVSLSEATTQEVSVNYATADNGSATAGSDYEAISGTLVFAPGTLTQNITVQIVGDDEVEQDETFTVELVSPLNGVLSAGSTAIGTIVNDDSAGGGGGGNGGGRNKNRLPEASAPSIAGFFSDLDESTGAALSDFLSGDSDDDGVIDALALVAK